MTLKKLVLPVSAFIITGVYLSTHVSLKNPAPVSLPAQTVVQTGVGTSSGNRVAAGQLPSPLQPAAGGPAAILRGARWGVDTVREPAFAAFQGWVQKLAKAEAAERAQLEREGVALARTRYREMARLIEKDPERALQLAVPPAVAQRLPASVRELLEETVNTRGDYEVLCSYPLAGQPTAGLVRAARIHSETLEVFTYGPGLDFLTRRDVPLNGIAVRTAALEDYVPSPVVKAGKLMALAASPARILGAEDLQAWQAEQTVEPRCTVTGEPLAKTAEVTALQWGGEVYPFSSMALAVAWATTNQVAAQLDQPQTPANLTTAASSYTEGRKRFIVFRVDFPDYAGEIMTTNQALNLVNDTASFMSDISYGKHIIAPVGQGSDITPTMRLPNNVETYQDMGNLLGACRTAATALGYDMNQYDFYFVCTAGKPSASFAGLGYVGGVGFWLANSYFNVRTCAHEFGHNLGLGHANWWNTGGKSMMGAGTSDEYGDDFDTMGGSGGGILHFSSYSKNKLGWIPNSDCLTVSTSGTYRLYAHDNMVANSGVRGLRFARSGDDYWMEFRQRFANNKALMNGMAVRWVGGSTTLLDGNPGSASGKNDHPVTIGRTFMDAGLGVYVTPVGKGNTYPESLDVVVKMGTFAGNRAPEVVAASASAVTPAANQAVTFSATAEDADGDALAYFWDFGDGDYSVDNSAVTTHSFSGTGEYYVECTVSDMKGGEARRSVLVKVGTPTTYSISGRVLTTNSLPVVGAKVWVDSSHYAFSESDGAFAITRLGAGAYTVSITEPFLGAVNYVNPFFNNPVTVGPNFTNADFVVYPGVLQIQTPLVAKGANWKYLDDGTDQGMAWRAAGFNDAGWSNGAAVLGYGQGNESTVIGYGPSSTNKYITYYFRSTFTAANPSAFTNVQLQALRDDGIVVYLNSQEVFRDNLGTGVVTNGTRAISAVEPDTYLSTNIAASYVQAGVNQVAVELHQVEPTSSDLNFDLALTGITLTNSSGLNVCYLASPRDHATYATGTNLAWAVAAQSGGAAITQVVFYADAVAVGADAVAPYGGGWSNLLAGTHVLQAVALRAGAPALTSAPVSIEVATPVTVPAPAQVNMILAGSNWRFFTGPTGAPPTWAEISFADAGWSNGAAQFGYGENDETTKISYGPDANNKWITAYFRRSFVVQDAAAITNVTLQLKRDDGAVVYLNGAEILRDQMPQGDFTYATLATNAPDDGQNFNQFNLGQLPLRPGTNVVAVEIHQSATNSSDQSFDLSFTGLSYTNRLRGIWIVAPTNGARLSGESPIAIATEAVAGLGAVGVREVQFYAEGARLGVTTEYPYAFAWSNAPAGSATITAVIVNTAGQASTSAPVSIVIDAPPPGTQLISFGELWKYQDDGANLGTNWIGRTFDDRSWPAGAGRLGYGGDGEVTVVSDGGDPNNRHITTYFRKTFVVANPAAFQHLLLRLRFDDGAVVYLNGKEVVRTNLNAGWVSFNSLANATVSGAAEAATADFVLAPILLTAGTNVIAVEVHQSSITSSDLGFDLALLGQGAGGSGVYLAAPAAGEKFISPARVTLAAVAAGAQLAEFFDGQTKLGEATGTLSLNWTNAAQGEHSLWTRATFAGGLVTTSAPVAISVIQAPLPIQPVANALIPAGSVWTYWDNVTAVSEGWQQPAFDDAAWQVGGARFGWGLDGEKTEITAGRVTHYFRKWFVVTNPAVLTELSFQLARDDGAVVYLNGREMYRSNMPSGTVKADTLASTTVNTPDETTYFETVIPVLGSGLLAGSNLVAVELHQSSTTSSDAGFDLQLAASGTTEPRIFLMAPYDGQRVILGQPVALGAQAWAGAGLTAGLVEFYINGVKYGETPAGAAQLSWSNAPLGSYLVSARVQTAQGWLTSATNRLEVTYQPVSLSLVSTGAVWSFWDRGTQPAINWTQRGYSDQTWSNGPARFGYGGDGEITSVSYGGNANSKYITTYFRRWFTVPENTTLTNLIFRMVRDDGAVVYLNGMEVFRSNMANTPVSNTMVATAAVSGTDEQTYFETVMPVQGLLAGTNVIAVEIHQSAANSSDLGFDLALQGEGYTGVLPQARLAVPLVASSRFQLAWPTNMFGWALYYSPSLTAGTWTKVTSSVTQTNGVNLYQVQPNQGSGFFRLEQR